MKYEKYDMQIICPVIPSRLKSFQKYGFYNLKEKKVLLHCLIGTHDKEQYREGWPPSLDVEIISLDTDNPVIQIYDFLSKLKPEDIVGDWIAKIDDDSFNDIENLINNFNKHYDYNKEFYIAAQIRDDMNNYEVDLLKKLNLWFQIDERFTHEYEACWLSKPAIQNILKNENCIQLFRERSKISGGFTDQCLGAAARLCKIYPVRDYHCSVSSNEFYKCSLIMDNIIHNESEIKSNNSFFHFHPICQSKNLMPFYLFSTILKNILPTKELIFLENKKYFLIKENKEEEVESYIINMLPSCAIKSKSDFKFYLQIENDLILISIANTLQYVVFKNFNLEEGKLLNESLKENKENKEYNFKLIEYIQ
jgi:hypothetical protein